MKTIQPNSTAVRFGLWVVALALFSTETLLASNALAAGAAWNDKTMSDADIEKSRRVLELARKMCPDAYDDWSWGECVRRAGIVSE